MSKLRPECKTSNKTSWPTDVIYQRLYSALSGKRGLIYGQLTDADGAHCAMGSFWERFPDAVVPAGLVDEIAAINDSKLAENKFKRWQRVRAYLRRRLKTLGIEV